MRWLTLALPFLLMGCLEQKAESQCFELTAETQNVMPVMVNKCTGETWILTKKTLVYDDGKTPSATGYIWTTLIGEGIKTRP